MRNEKKRSSLNEYRKRFVMALFCRNWFFLHVQLRLFQLEGFFAFPQTNVSTLQQSMPWLFVCVLLCVCVCLDFIHSIPYPFYFFPIIVFHLMWMCIAFYLCSHAQCIARVKTYVRSSMHHTRQYFCFLCTILPFPVGLITHSACN